MDPIGFAPENFDWMCRWRDKETNGKPLDISGVVPSGERRQPHMNPRRNAPGR